MCQRVIIFGLLVLAAPRLWAQPGFSSWSHLLGRHPSLANDKQFQAWLNRERGDLWHEQLSENRRSIVVVVQNRLCTLLFAARFERPEDIKQPEILKQTAIINLIERKISRGSALEAFVDAGNRLEDITVLRPAVMLREGKPPDVRWEISAKRVDDQPQDFIFTRDKGLQVKDEEQPERRDEAGVRATLLMDSLASNELHHLEEFADDVVDAVGGASTRYEKAQRIIDYIRLAYVYDATIVGIDAFTWADTLTRDDNGRRGICDEWAIVQVTMLRQAGIEARYKIIRFRNSLGEDVAHACIEYRDGAKWVHMDALYNEHDLSAAYRLKYGCSEVTVIDADYPDDTRSTSHTHGFADISGDLKLNSYYDFILTPDDQGNERPGYSL